MKNWEKTEDEIADESLTYSILEKLIYNIQIKITNIHIQYRSDNNCSFGFFIPEFSLLSTNSEWQVLESVYKRFLSLFLPKNPHELYKLCKFDSLCLYICPNDEINVEALTFLSYNDIKKCYNDYMILKPTEFNMKFWIDDNPINNIQMNFSHVIINISKQQYNGIMNSIQLLSYINSNINI